MPECAARTVRSGKDGSRQWQGKLTTASGSEQKRVLRLIPELRNYHVANEMNYTPSATYYFHAKYDLSVPVPTTITKISYLTAIRLAFDRRYSQLVIWEPLWVRLLPLHALVVLAWKLGSLRSRPVLSYAMENNDAAALLGGNRKVPRGIAATFRLALGSYVRFAYTRIAYASDGARQNYQQLPGVAAVESRTIPNLPARAPLKSVVGEAHSVVMIARMEKRKGTDVIMGVWPEVEEGQPKATLTIVGSGPESDVVSEWSLQSPSTRTFLGPLPHAKVLEVVSGAAVLVLPSVRDGRWREQIGLPLHEALLKGLTIVTTDETGLAGLLQANGHQIVRASDVCTHLGSAILKAISEPLDRTDVIALLPPDDARATADRWLANWTSAS